MNPILHKTERGEVIAEGRFLVLKHVDTWEYVERRRSTGVVAILAITDENKILLIEQVRRAIGKVVVEIPAGLAGDITGSETEEIASAAQRELLEETGYEAQTMEYLTRGPSSAGITNEMITFFRASGLTRTFHRIGDGSEEITFARGAIGRCGFLARRAKQARARNRPQNLLRFVLRESAAKVMKNPFEGILLGTAVGDSIGLPAEGLSTSQIAKRWPGPWKQRLILGTGMVSDDTEHTVFVAQSLINEPSDPDRFLGQLAGRLRLWLLCLPAGIGFATLRAILKLWMGFPPRKSGVFSAGNGPAMRSAILGVYFANDIVKLRAYVRASTQLTHIDPKAETAALAVALTAAWASRSDIPPADCLNDLNALWLESGDDMEWKELVAKIRQACERKLLVKDFTESLGLVGGVTGYAYHTVPVALYAWLRHHGDFQASVESVVCCGGDTDTMGAITGALAALNSPIPPEWLEHLRDQPVSVDYLRELATTLETTRRGGGRLSPVFAWPLLPIRNLLFLGVILGHGFRRLLPL